MAGGTSALTFFNVSGTLASYGITAAGQQIIPVSAAGGIAFGLSNLFPLYVSSIATTTAMSLALTSSTDVASRIASLNATSKASGVITVSPALVINLAANQPVVFRSTVTDSAGGTLVPGNIYYIHATKASGSTTISVKNTTAASTGTNVF
jgi:hypothetical protein